MLLVGQTRAARVEVEEAIEARDPENLQKALSHAHEAGHFTKLNEQCIRWRPLLLVARSY